MNRPLGEFTSSEIWKLMGVKGFGETGLTYIKERQWGLLCGRHVGKEVDAKATSWGILLEPMAFDKLEDLSYRLRSKERRKHTTIPFWSGSPDLVGDGFIGDIKCPFTLKSFCEGVDSFGDVDKFKDTKKEWYWQLVSNAILFDVPQAEIVIYCPYKKDLKAIRDEANNQESGQSKFAFINFLDDEQLPYLIEGKHYQDLNKFRFEVPKEDIELLTERVTKATELLKGDIL